MEEPKENEDCDDGCHCEQPIIRVKEGWLRKRLKKAIFGPKMLDPTIVSPTELLSEYEEGDHIIFSVNIHGGGNLPEGCSVIWTSNKQGIIGKDIYFIRCDLVRGLHKIDMTILQSGNPVHFRKIYINIRKREDSR